MNAQTIIERLAQTTAFSGVAGRLAEKAHTDGNAERENHFTALDYTAHGVEIAYKGLLMDLDPDACKDWICKANQRAEDLDGIIRMQLFVKHSYRMDSGLILTVNDAEAAYLIQ